MSHQKLFRILSHGLTSILTSRLTLCSRKKIRLFKVVLATNVPHVTHQTLGDYIRQRRLLLAAVSCAPPSVRFLISQWTWVMSRADLLPRFPSAV